MKPIRPKSGPRSGIPRGAAGFTLLELLIVMALFSLVMTGVYTAYRSQQKSYLVQEQVAAMQQNLRAGMFYLSQAIRMAGYDPEDTAIPGLVSAMPGFTSDGATCDDTTIAFTLDDNANRVIDSNDTEKVAFRLSDQMTLERFSTGAIRWQTVVENVESLRFTYLDGSGNVTGTLADVRSVQVALTVRTALPDRDYPGDGYRRRTLTSRLQCRNLGL